MKRLWSGAFGLLLVGAMVSGLSGVTESATAARPDDPPVQLLERPMAGAAAVRALGSDLPAAAQRNRMSPEHLSTLLTKDPTTRVSRTGRLYYVDGGRDQGTAASAVAASTVAAPLYPLDKTFALHTRSNAHRTIYLDFNGAKVLDTDWNGPDLPNRTYIGWSLDSDHSTFSSTERAFIQDVWSRVAEDYAPFDVDVTTQDPGRDALVRSTTTDGAFGARAVITDDDQAWTTLCAQECSGVAYIGVFNKTDDGASQPAWIFGGDIGRDNQWMGDVISHEVGHNLGLEHDGTLSGSEYYSGQGIWQPIMGNGYHPLSQFSNGDYSDANNKQNDFSVIRSYGAPTNWDDYGSSPDDAHTITSTVQGTIEDRNDADWFEVKQACAGPLSIEALPAAIGPNLDIGLEVQSADGQTLATVDPTAKVENNVFTGLDAGWSSDSLPAGTYRFGIDGVGNGSPLSTGYSDYGSVGIYGVWVHTTPCPRPGAVASVSLTDRTPTSLQVRWTPPTFTGGTSITQYQVRLGSGSWTKLTPSTRSYRFRGLFGAKTYAVSVRAVNSTGPGTSTSRSYRTEPPVRASAPRIALASWGTTGGPVNAVARWYPPATNGGAPITAYRVYALRMSSTGTVLWKTYKTIAPARSYVFALPRGAYRFQVIAVTKVGASLASARSNLVGAR